MKFVRKHATKIAAVVVILSVIALSVLIPYAATAKTVTVEPEKTIFDNCDPEWPWEPVPGPVGPQGPPGPQGPIGPQGPVGEKGEQGIPGVSIVGPQGANGLNGQDGIDGKNGINGKDGVGISSIKVNEDFHLIVTYTNGRTEDAGLLPSGKDGIDGKDGTNGQPPSAEEVKEEVAGNLPFTSVFDWIIAALALVLTSLISVWVTLAIVKKRFQLKTGI